MIKPSFNDYINVNTLASFHRFTFRRCANNELSSRW